ncbi:MAG: hypothetical protein RHS_5179 [Robinsoniella sp. RHS]|nr:MAG: hypothetical protein RHS_5179 [Robinsoniella sp. RHS]
MIKRLIFRELTDYQSFLYGSMPGHPVESEIFQEAFNISIFIHKI